MKTGYGSRRKCTGSFQGHGFFEENLGVSPNIQNLNSLKDPEELWLDWRQVTKVTAASFYWNDFGGAFTCEAFVYEERGWIRRIFSYQECVRTQQPPFWYPGGNQRSWHCGWGMTVLIILVMRRVTETNVERQTNTISRGQETKKKCIRNGWVQGAIYLTRSKWSC